MGIKTRLSSTKPILYIGYAVLILFLGYAVSRAGYFYMFDNDEVSHAQVAYLLNRGYAPYRDFFSVYPIIFDWILSALFTRTGFTFDALFAGRLLMIILFWMRIAGAAILTYTLFGTFAAALFVPLSLLDPFTVFSGMQIRPDNLMLVFFIYALILFLAGIRKKNRFLLLISGVLSAMSVLTLPKILPSAAAFTLIAVWYLMKNRKSGFLTAWGAGIVCTVFLSVIPFAADGSLGDMLQQTVFDARSTNNALLYPVKLGSFYYADNNIFLYGHPGKPLTWMYVWILPLVSFAGLYHVASGFLKKRTHDAADFVGFALCWSLVLQWTSLLFIHSVFLQYYIPITWLFAIFTAVLLTDMYALLSQSKPWRIISAIAGIGLITALAYIQVTGNLNRTAYDNATNRKYFMGVWSVIGADEAVFPNALFRPLAYPLPYGYFYADIPPEIISRYPPLDTVLENQKIRVLLVDDYFLEKLPERYRSYITAHYVKSAEPVAHYTRVR